MKIFGLMVLKNEADIVGETLVRAMAWCDRVAVLDNASTDESVAQVDALARAYPGRIDRIGVFDGLFHNDLRMIPFRHLLPEASAGDWWCRLDADEIYPDDPRAFLGRLSPHDCRVNAIHLFYEFTDRDLAAWEAGRESLADRQRPIGQRRRYYRATYQELRFMRHHPRLAWRAAEHWPRPRGPLSPRLILVQHFRSRDPVQLQARYAVRQRAAELGQRKPDHHWRVDAANWRQLVVASSACAYDRHDGCFSVDYGRFRQRLGKRVGQSLRRGLMRLGFRS